VAFADECLGMDLLVLNELEDDNQIVWLYVLLLQLYKQQQQLMD